MLTVGVKHGTGKQEDAASFCRTRSCCDYSVLERLVKLLISFFGFEFLYRCYRNMESHLLHKTLVAGMWWKRWTMQRVWSFSIVHWLKLQKIHQAREHKARWYLTGSKTNQPYYSMTTRPVCVICSLCKRTKNLNLQITLLLHVVNCSSLSAVWRSRLVLAETYSDHGPIHTC